MYQPHLDPAIACVHRRRITECEHCVAERMEWLAWQRRMDQLIEAESESWQSGGWDRYIHGWAEHTEGAWPISDPVPTLTRGGLRG